MQSTFLNILISLQGMQAFKSALEMSYKEARLHRFKAEQSEKKLAHFSELGF